MKEFLSSIFTMYALYFVGVLFVILALWYFYKDSNFSANEPLIMPSAPPIPLYDPSWKAPDNPRDDPPPDYSSLFLRETEKSVPLKEFAN